MTGSLDALAGTVLADKYRLVSLLGRGGMGYVYQAEQLGLGRSVAVKLLHPEQASASGIQRFRAEGVAASRINHPNAVAVYDFGVTAADVPYLVMEHLRGNTLAELLASNPLSSQQIVDIGAQVLAALSEAHHCGVIHRDLTASNVIIERLRGGQDYAKVIDFGLSQLFGTAASENAWYGTAEYIAPELARGEVIGPGFDLYAMGCLLYEMIVGRTPFGGRPPADIVTAHMEEEPLPPHVLIPTCSQALSELVSKALAKQPDQRHEHAAAMRDALLAVLDGDSKSVRCPACGTRGPATARFCSDCGAEVACVRSGDSLVAPEEVSFDDEPTLARVSRHTSRLLADFAQSERGAHIGRRDELTRIMEFCRREGRSRTLAIVGPDGIGKSRTVMEAGALLGPSTPMLWTGAHPMGIPMSWYPIMAMLHAVLEEPEISSFDQLEHALRRCGLPADDTPAVAEMYGLAGPMAELELAMRRGEVFPAVVRALVSVEQRRPGAVLVFADIDRFDDASLRVVHELSRALQDSGPRMIVTAEVASKLPDDAGRITLGGLSPQESGTLTRKLVGEEAQLPPALTIHSLTSGYPAAVVQLAGWILMGYSVADVPALRVDLVSVRVNRLPVAARRVLQAIAMHGTTMPRALLREMVDLDELLLALDDVAWTGLLYGDHREVTIPTELVAQVVAASTPADVRRELHRNALLALAPTAHDAVIGHHAHGAAELHVAWGAYLAAGHDAVRRLDDRGAGHWYRCALQVAREMHNAGEPDGAARFIDAAVRLADVLRHSGQLGLAGGILDEADLADPDIGQRAEISRARGRNELAAGHPERAAQHLNRAIGLALRDGDRAALAETYVYLADALIAAGDSVAAVQELEGGAQLLALHDGGTGPADSKLWRLGLRLAEMHLQLGHADASHRCALDALHCAERAESPLGCGRVSDLLARISDLGGEPALARVHRQRAIAELLSVGDRKTAWTLQQALGASDSDSVAKV